MTNKIPEDILFAVYRSMLGEIYPAIRAIAISYNSARLLVIRYYLDRVPTDYDRDSLGCVMTEVLSDLPPDAVTDVREECMHSELPMKDLDVLDMFVYARREWEEKKERERGR
jgi:hypothetical protein